MPTLHSHTHCQVAQTDTQTKTWQRVCLSNRTADRPTDDRKEQRRHNSSDRCTISPQSTQIL